MIKKQNQDNDEGQLEVEEEQEPIAAPITTNRVF
jgi:hypothetical protein